MCEDVQLRMLLPVVSEAFEFPSCLTRYNDEVYLMRSYYKYGICAQYQELWTHRTELQANPVEDCSIFGSWRLHLVRGEIWLV